MTEPNDVPATDLIDQVSARVRDRFGAEEASTAEALVRTYYAHVVRQDLDGRSPGELYGAAISHLQMARHRQPGELALRIYSPTVEDDGWRSPHTVIDLVTDDMPFIVATVLMAVDAAELGLHLLIHPVLDVRRDRARLVGPAGQGPGDDVREAYVHLEVDQILDAERRDRLAAAITHSLAAVRAAVDDWRPMVERATQLADELEERSTTPGGDDASDAAELLRWMADEFVFLGARDYQLDPDEGVVRSIDGSGLGILRDAPPSARPLSTLALAGRQRVLSDDILIITKTNARSPVHRPARMDYVGVRRRDPDTGVITERRFLGLFTARAYTETVTRLPVVRRKAATIVARAGFTPGSHDASRLLLALEDHPRDELFQASVDELLPTILDIVHLYERHQVRLFVRTDSFGRSVSCLVYVPRDRFRTEVREAIQHALEAALGGPTTDFDVSFSSSSLARLHLIVTIPPDAPVPTIDVKAVETQLEHLTRSWTDHLERELVDQLGEGRGTTAVARWRGAFPASYREDRTPESAIADIERLDELAEEPTGTLAVRTYHPPEVEPGVLRVKLYRFGEPVRLSTILPLLQNHGVAVLDERAYEVTPADGPPGWIHDFGLLLPRAAAENIEQHGPAMRERLEESILAAWDGRTESDPFGELVLLAGLDWREVSIIRAFARYLRQTGATFTPTYIQEVVRTHAGIARLLVDRFHLRLDPDHHDEERDAEVAEWIHDALDAVPRLDEDRILRGLDALVTATLRTNFYQRGPDGQPPAHLVVKFDPAQVPDLPAPRPAHEIYVSSPRVEGVHLRAGRVARGGIRWSDRREDYRTEVLALLKAQVVKNSLIVPAGAKGGFVCRQLGSDDDPGTVRAEVEACYRSFIGALLDVTDNIVDGEVVPPARVRRLDGDDPYLVVAADRGTATFSDVANEIATSRGFWLGDAFASGGSTGYDHKAMGITARGAWVSVRRHMAALGIDPERDPITVVGIGDMSGDVFGNGMLRSRTMKLVAAFDHRHVFVDPDPDPDRSYAERERLYALAGSTWADYDRSLLSPGGLVVPRSAKSVTIDARAAAVLGCAPGTMTPNELIRTILQAPVDLLWNGGIGTYVKASTERHDEVGDRTNDAVRIDADELRCRVVGEGGNLGFTQLGRVEAALGGVRINTDAIDNSGGVDSSDREVNLKILLDLAVAEGSLTVRQRNELLAGLTDEVARLVLEGNAAQTLALAIAADQAAGMVHVHARLLAWLEAHAGLDRALEALPSDESLAERARDGIGLTQPELAVAMAYVKNLVAGSLLDSALPDDPDLRVELEAYVPEPLRPTVAHLLDQHPLRRELIATELTNRLVDRAGLTVIMRLVEETAASVPEVVTAIATAWRLLELDQRWDRIRAVIGEVPIGVAIEMLQATKALGERASRWLIRNRHAPLDISATLAELGPPVRRIVASIEQVATPSSTQALDEHRDRWVAAGVPADLATEVAHGPLASMAFDIVGAARAEGAELELAARVFFLIDDRLGLGWLRQQIDDLPRDDQWSTLARTALRDDLFHEHAALVRRILASGRADDAHELCDRWVRANHAQIDRAFDVLVDIRSIGTPGLEHLSVALREIRNLMRRAGGVTPTATDE